jgi:hypothetical protein
MLEDYHIEIDNVNKEMWSDLLIKFDDASIYQTWQYGKVLYGDKNLSHIILFKNDEVVSIAQVGIKKIRFTGTGVANIHCGPIWRKKKDKNFDSAFYEMISFLRKEYSKRRNLLLRIWPNEFKNEEKVLAPIFDKCCFTLNREVAEYRTIRLSLDQSLDELRKNFDQKWRNQLNKAEKNKLKILAGNSDQFYEKFLYLIKEMLIRKRFSPNINYNKFFDVQKQLNENLKMRIFLCEHSDEVIAAAVCSAIGQTGIYFFGATGDRGLKLNGSNLIQWYIIKWLKEVGCKWYDLGGIDPEKNPGVYHFKCGISGKIGQDQKKIGQYTNHSSLRSYLLLKLINIVKH